MKNIKQYLLSLPLLVIISLTGNIAWGQSQSYPDPHLLEELKQYSRQSVSCEDLSCNSINQIKFDLMANTNSSNGNPKEITASFYVSARKSSFIELPFKEDELKLSSVLMDNKPWYQVIHDESTFKVVVPQGEHVVSVQLNMTSNILSLSRKFPNVEVSSGLSLDERNGSSVITLKEGDNKGHDTAGSKNGLTDNSFEKSNYPTEAFYQVSRTLYLNDTWKVVTQITPLFETNKSTTLEIPLLKGERVLSSDIKVDNDKAIVNLSNQVVSWESNLSSVDQLVIPPVTSNNYSQVFSLASSNLWQYAVKGKNPFSIKGDSTSWALWSGEQLDLTFKAPTVLPGKTLSLNNLSVAYSKEHDTNFYSYSLNAYTSLAGKTFFTLPENYKIEELTINNLKVNIDKNTQKIPVDLHFGDNTISFKISTDHSQTIFKTFPYVAFPETVYNSTYSLTSDNWIFLSGGSNINTEYILFSSLLFLVIITLITKKINPSLSYFTLGLVLFGFLQNSIEVMLFLPILLTLIKFKDLVIQRYNENKASLEYNLYQLILILSSIAFIVAFLITLKLGLLDTPSSWTLYNGAHIDWFNQIYSSKPIWYIEIDSTVYHIFMFIWAIFVSYQLVNISKLAFKSIFSFELWIKKQSVISSGIPVELKDSTPLDNKESDDMFIRKNNSTSPPLIDDNMDDIEDDTDKI